MKNNIVIAEKETVYEKAINSSFGEENVIYLPTIEEKMTKIEEIAESIKNSKNITFFNLAVNSNLLLNILPKKINKNAIFQYSISELSDINLYNQLLLLLKYLDSGLIQNVYCLEYSTYLIFKEKYNFKYLQLDIEKESENSGEGIGIIAPPNDKHAGIMNELSGISLTDYKTVKITKPRKVVQNFCKKFNIHLIKVKSIEEAISNNEINLYVNFCGISYSYILESMDKGIPCIVGNTDFFDSNKLLKEYLVLKSDDSINEIKDKIILVRDNKEKILDEYQKFRKDYSKKAKKSLSKFIDELK